MQRRGLPRLLRTEPRTEETFDTKLKFFGSLLRWIASGGKDLQSGYGAQDLLDFLHRAWARRRFRAAALVGAGRDRSYRLCLVVGGLPPRLVRVTIVAGAETLPSTVNSLPRGSPRSLRPFFPCS